MERKPRHLDRLVCFLIALGVVLASATTQAAARPTQLALATGQLAPQDWGAIRALLPPAQQAYLKASNTGANDSFGSTVAVAGDTVVVGAAYEDSGATGMNGDQTSNAAFQSGAAYVFVREGARWRQQAYLKASNTAMFDLFGSSVAAADDTVAVGAYGEASAATGVDGDQADNGAPYAGAAYVFVREETGWRQQAYLKASNTEAHDFFGVSVAAAGDTVVVGADSEDSSATGVNGNQTNNAASYAGAAYVMTGLGISPTPNATPAPPTATPIETATAIPALRVQIYIPAVWAE